MVYRISACDRVVTMINQSSGQTSSLHHKYKSFQIETPINAGMQFNCLYFAHLLSTLSTGRTPVRSFTDKIYR